MHLVADIGGTNTRLALADGNRPRLSSARSYSNDDYPQFQAVLDDYLSAMQGPDITGACIAIAGPVRGDIAQLTNRDWVLDSDRITQHLGASTTVLMNDLAALGYALPHLSGDQTEMIRPAASGARSNGQSFVLGLGTGVNLAASLRSPAGYTVLEAEAGHTALPAHIRAILVTEAGEDTANRLNSLEELLAGRGLPALHSGLTGQPTIPGHRIIAQQDPASQRTVTLFSRLFGLTLRELILLYLPLDGVFLSGSVARAVLSAAPAPFLEALAAPHMMSEIIATPAIQVIRDDAAALHGCAARLSG